MAGFCNRIDGNGFHAAASAAECSIEEYFSMTAIQVPQRITSTQVQDECDSRITNKFYFNNVHHSTRDLMDISHEAFLCVG